ncbi:hypothetical protein F2P56_032307 [Juglans regia]|uniref:Uncharacterized protein n=1 Tax=Juglans regia TaxID=51240 RepID=A0A833SSG2_JUGRE|nr:hypothetical protein F2P56_032307 [Juglans regia]
MTTINDSSAQGKKIKKQISKRKFLSVALSTSNAVGGQTRFCASLEITVAHLVFPIGNHTLVLFTGVCSDYPASSSSVTRSKYLACCVRFHNVNPLARLET